MTGTGQYLAGVLDQSRRRSSGPRAETQAVRSGLLAHRATDSARRGGRLSELSRIEREIKKVDRQIDRLESEALHVLRHARAEPRFEAIG